MAKKTQLDTAIAKLEADKQKITEDAKTKAQKIQDVIDVLRAMNGKTAAETAPVAEKPKRARGPNKRKAGLPATFAPEQGESGGLL